MCKILFLLSTIISDKIHEYYLSRLNKQINKNDIYYISLCNENNNIPKTSTDVKEHFKKIKEKIDLYNIKYVCISDANYFKRITKLNNLKLGYILNIDNIYYMYIPDYLDTKYNYEKTVHELTVAINSLNNHINNSYVDPGSDIIHYEYYPDTVNSIKESLDNLFKYNALTVDIETYSLKHYNSGLKSITFCWNQHEGIAFEIDDSLDNPNKEVRELLKDFFIKYSGTLIYHNISFDGYILVYQLFMNNLLDQKGLLEGLDIILKNWEDTKLITYLCTNSCAGNNLGLKEQSKEFAGDYALDEINNVSSIPINELLKYNLTDGLCTWYVYNKYINKLKQDNQEDIYINLFKPAVKDIIQMQLSGLPLDANRVLEVEKILEEDINKATNTLNNNRLIKDFVLLLNENWVEEKNKKLKVKKVILADAKETFNPNSNKQLQLLLYTFLNLPVINKTTSKAPATDGDTIKALINHTSDPEVLEILNNLIDYSAVSKILTAFIPAFKNAVPASDGRSYLFGNFNIGGTVSGRLSSSKINLQQLPSTGSKYAKLIKSCFKAPEGYLFIGLDYHSLEDYISALTTKDPNKLKVYLDGYDGHCLRAYSYFGEQMPDIEIAEPEEECYKIELDNGDILYIHENENIEYQGKIYKGKELYNLLCKI